MAYAHTLGTTPIPFPPRFTFEPLLAQEASYLAASANIASLPLISRYISPLLQKKNKSQCSYFCSRHFRYYIETYKLTCVILVARIHCAPTLLKCSRKGRVSSTNRASAEPLPYLSYNQEHFYLLYNFFLPRPKPTPHY